MLAGGAGRAGDRRAARRFAAGLRLVKAGGCRWAPAAAGEAGPGAELAGEMTGRGGASGREHGHCCGLCKQAVKADK